MLYLGRFDVCIDSPEDEPVLEISFQYWTLARISISRNLARNLIAEWHDVKQKIAGIEKLEKLKSYTRHQDGCDGNPCSCGLEAA